MAAGTPADLREAIAGAPAEERALLELRLEWSGLDDARARIAARLRVFLLTWDPLYWHDRPAGWSTATGDGDGCEVVLYLPLEQVLETVASDGRGSRRRGGEPRSFRARRRRRL